MNSIQNYFAGCVLALGVAGGANSKDFEQPTLDRKTIAEVCARVHEAMMRGEKKIDTRVDGGRDICIPPTDIPPSPTFEVPKKPFGGPSIQDKINNLLKNVSPEWSSLLLLAVIGLLIRRRMHSHQDHPQGNNLNLIPPRSTASIPPPTEPLFPPTEPLPSSDPTPSQEEFVSQAETTPPPPSEPLPSSDPIPPPVEPLPPSDPTPPVKKNFSMMDEIMFNVNLGLAQSEGRLEDHIQKMIESNISYEEPLRLLGEVKPEKEKIRDALEAAYVKGYLEQYVREPNLDPAAIQVIEGYFGKKDYQANEGDLQDLCLYYRIVKDTKIEDFLELLSELFPKKDTLEMILFLERIRKEDGFQGLIQEFFAELTREEVSEGKSAEQAGEEGEEL